MGKRWGIFQNNDGTLYAARVLRDRDGRDVRMNRSRFKLARDRDLPHSGVPICKSKSEALRMLAVYTLRERPPNIIPFP